MSTNHSPNNPISTNPDKLVSVIVLSYQSKSSISRAIHSIISQDYSRIEIIIADDCSSDFSRSYIDSLFEQAKRDSPIPYTVIQQPRNVGTVKNLNSALSHISGDYFIIIGADDYFPDTSIISAYMDTFAIRQDKPLLISGLADMRTKDLNRRLRILPDCNALQALQSEDPSLLLDALASQCVPLIVATCFRAEFLKALHPFDTCYKYYEDYPTFIRMARSGIAPAFLDKITITHPAGGIANNTDDRKKALSLKLHQDRNRMWRRELDPYKKLLSPEARRLNRQRRNNERKNYLQLRSSTLYRLLSALKAFFVRPARRTSTHRAIGCLRFGVLCAILECCITIVAPQLFLLSSLTLAAAWTALLLSLWFFIRWFTQPNTEQHRRDVSSSSSRYHRSPDLVPAISKGRYRE